MTRAGQSGKLWILRCRVGARPQPPVTSHQKPVGLRGDFVLKGGVLCVGTGRDEGPVSESWDEIVKGDFQRRIRLLLEAHEKSGRRPFGRRISAFRERRRASSRVSLCPHAAGGLGSLLIVGAPGAAWSLRLSPSATFSAPVRAFTCPVRVGLETLPTHRAFCGHVRYCIRERNQRPRGAGAAGAFHQQLDV